MQLPGVTTVFGRRRRNSLPETIAHSLRKEIFQGKYAPGDRLPSENSLAKEYNTNRTTLREAIRILSSEGFLDVGQGRPAEIRDYRRTGTVNLLTPYLESLKSEADALELVEDMLWIRREFLCMITPQAVAAATEDDLAAVDAAVVGVLTHRGHDTQTINQYDRAVYVALIESTHNMLYRFFFNTFLQAFQPLSQRASSIVSYPPAFFDGLQHFQTAFRSAAEGTPNARPVDALRVHLATVDRTMLGMIREMQEHLDATIPVTTSSSSDTEPE